MPKEKAIALIGEIHDRFASDERSPQQAQLLSTLERHIHTLGDDEAPEPSLVESLEVFLNETEMKHPQLSAVLKNLLDTMKNIGI